jgi:hypothetical protein
MQYLKSLLPETNILNGYVAGAFVFAVVHLLGYLNIVLTSDQSSNLSTKAALFAAIVTAHLTDSINKAKVLQVPPQSVTTQKTGV